MAMNDSLELEISLSRRDRDRYTVELRVNDPRSDQIRMPEIGAVSFDDRQLQRHRLDPSAYGQQLFKDLFGPENLLRLYDEVRGVAQATNRPLRLRLYIHPDSIELQDLRWETLNDRRAGGGWLLTDERTRFSRFLSSATWEPATSRAAGKLSTLIVIANPSDLASGKYKAGGKALAPVDVAGEKERARQGLGPLFDEAQLLASDPAQPGQVTLDALRGQLRTGPDVVYLVCHGALLSSGERRGPQLLLESAAGTGELVAGNDLVDQIRNLDPALRPRLIVMASCQSAGSGGEDVTADASGALSALGPQLAQAGVPAVLAIQGSISMTTAGAFMSAFFEALRQDGQIDRAMAVARSAVAQRPDAWMPVLYLRLRDSNLWYTPRFSGGEAEEQLWGRLLAGVQDSEGRFTPILGPGLSEHLTGALGRAAQRWADEHNYPLDETSRGQMTQVAQYLARRDGPAAPREGLLRYMEQQIKARFPEETAEVNGLTPQEVLEKQIARIAHVRRERFQDDPYKLLAQLRFPIYVNANPDNLLTQAIIDEGRTPVVEYARWSTALRNFMLFPSDYETERQNGYVPSRDKPLVYHLFGTLKVSDSLILSEDDYFDYLVWINQPQPALPPPVGRALSINGLLFLGFGILDWDFRVLFRSILSDQRPAMRRAFKSMAVQVQPGADIRNPGLARAYLEQHFAGAEIGLYWGSVEDFIKNLRQQAQARGLL